jgi:hypothetical protein
VSLIDEEKAADAAPPVAGRPRFDVNPPVIPPPAAPPGFSASRHDPDGPAGEYLFYFVIQSFFVDSRRFLRYIILRTGPCGSSSSTCVLYCKLNKA